MFDCSRISAATIMSESGSRFERVYASGPALRFLESSGYIKQRLVTKTRASIVRMSSRRL